MTLLRAIVKVIGIEADVIFIVLLAKIEQVGVKSELEQENVFESRSKSEARLIIKYPSKALLRVTDRVTKEMPFISLLLKE